MAIELATKYMPYVDEVFTQESKRDLITNNGFSFTGAGTVKIYKIGTAPMNDYGRAGAAGGNWSRYGALENVDAETEEMTLEKDRSFTFVIDALDSDETGRTLAGATALARQVREVVIPEVDTYTYNFMAQAAGTRVKVTDTDDVIETEIYDHILRATETMDNALVPETGRVIIVPPSTHRIMKRNKEIIMSTEIGANDRKKGVIGIIDGCTVVRVAAARLPEGCIFMMAHPSATVAPLKLESYRTHTNPPGINGELVEGRINYDAFVLDNKKMGIYYLYKEVQQVP